MKFDVLKEFGDFLDNNVEGEFDWVTALPVYQHLYNTTLHKSLGESWCIHYDYVFTILRFFFHAGCSPFETFYGRNSNIYLTRMSKEKEWGSHIELVAIGELFGAPIQMIV